MFLKLFLSQKATPASVGFLLGLEPENGGLIRNFELSPIVTALQPRRLLYTYCDMKARRDSHT
jgi:hypothetical protein